MGFCSEVPAHWPPAGQTRKSVGMLPAASRGGAVRMLVLFRVPCEVDGDRGARGKPQTAACQPVGPLQGRPVWWLGPALSYATGKS